MASQVEKKGIGENGKKWNCSVERQNTDVDKGYSERKREKAGRGAEGDYWEVL